MVLTIVISEEEKKVSLFGENAFHQRDFFLEISDKEI
jgi:hypothetical protein